MTAPDTAPAWPDRRTPKSPAIGDTVEIGTVMYTVTGLHTVDDGLLLRLHDGRRPRFVLAHELAWQAAGYWAPETEAEARAAYGDR